MTSGAVLGATLSSRSGIYGAASAQPIAVRPVEAQSQAAQSLAVTPLGHPSNSTIAQRLANVRFADANGTMQSLSDYRGRGVVLNFWATWCIPCLRELPWLESLSEVLSPDRIAVLPITTDHRAPLAVRSIMREHNAHELPVLQDPNDAAARLLGVSAMPTTFLIDRNGRQVLRVNQMIDWSDAVVVASVRRALA